MHVSPLPSPVKARTAAERRAVALAMFDAASAQGDAADWRAVAEALKAAMPAARASTAQDAPAYAPWEHHPAPVLPPFGSKAQRPPRSEVVAFTFADGEEVRAYAPTRKGRPLNIGLAASVAVSKYKARQFNRHRLAEPGEYHGYWLHCIQAPELVSISAPDGAMYDLTEANARTAEHRAGTLDVPAMLAEAASRDLPAIGSYLVLTYLRFKQLRYEAAAWRHAAKIGDAAPAYADRMARLADARVAGADAAELERIYKGEPARRPLSPMLRSYLGSTSRVALSVVR